MAFSMAETVCMHRHCSVGPPGLLLQSAIAEMQEILQPRHHVQLSIVKLLPTDGSKDVTTIV